MTIAEVAIAARNGAEKLALTKQQMAQLIAELDAHPRYGTPVQPPFFLLGVWIEEAVE
jgi:hypothetical protein